MDGVRSVASLLKDPGQIVSSLALGFGRQVTQVTSWRLAMVAKTVWRCAKKEWCSLLVATAAHSLRSSNWEILLCHFWCGPHFEKICYGKIRCGPHFGKIFSLLFFGSSIINGRSSPPSPSLLSIVVTEFTFVTTVVTVCVLLRYVFAFPIFLCHHLGGC